MLRLGPGHRAAEIASARAQLDRHQIAGALRHAPARKADQNPAIGDEFRDALVIGAGDLADVGQHQHRDMLVQRVADRARGDIGIGRQCPRQIIQARQQRLLVLRIGRGHQPDLAPLGRGVEQAHRTGRIGIGDDQAFALIAQFQRHLQRRLRHGAAGREVECGGGQRLAMGAQRLDAAVARAVAAGPDHRQLESLGAVVFGLQGQRHLPGGVAVERDIAELGQRLRRLRRVVMVDPVAEPQDLRLGDLGLGQRLDGAGAIGRPGLRHQFAGAARGLAGVEQADLRGAAARGRHDGDGPVRARGAGRVRRRSRPRAPSRHGPPSSHCR